MKQALLVALLGVFVGFFYKFRPSAPRPMSFVIHYPATGVALQITGAGWPRPPDNSHRLIERVTHRAQAEDRADVGSCRYPSGPRWPRGLNQERCHCSESGRRKASR